jgi:predicted dinucleotide-utilizing enzyme
MPDKFLLLSEAANTSWDYLVASAGAILGLTSEVKASRTLIAFGVTIFLAGVGLSAAWQVYLGLPARVEVMESTIKQMGQDLCVIRGAIEGIDPIRCLRDLP